MPQAKRKLSRYRGVVANQGDGAPWLVILRSKSGPTTYLGPFGAEEEAAMAYDAHFGAVPGWRPSKLNFPPKRRTTPAPKKRRVIGPGSLRQRIIARCRAWEADGVLATEQRLAETFPGTDIATLKTYRAAAKSCDRLKGRTPKARAIEIRALNTACIRTAEEREAKRLARLRRGPAADRWTALQRQSSGRATQ